MRRIAHQGTQSRAPVATQSWPADATTDGAGASVSMRVVSSVSDPNDGALVDAERVQMAPYA